MLLRAKMCVLGRMDNLAPGAVLPDSPKLLRVPDLFATRHDLGDLCRDDLSADIQADWIASKPTRSESNGQTEVFIHVPSPPPPWGVSDGGTYSVRPFRASSKPI